MKIIDSARIDSVSEVTARVKEVIEGSAALRYVKVRGEISDISQRKTRLGSNALYFTLKDRSSQLPAAMFEGVDDIGFVPQKGDLVVCEGMIAVYAPYGKYQLKCYSMTEDGAGAAAEALEKLKAKLLDEGVFSQKRPLPKYPKRIAVVTSPSGAAVRDIINVISRRYPITVLTVVPAYVQGANAVPSLIAGIRRAQTMGADLIIFGRGGGSNEDLDCFNSEALAREIFASGIPTVSAVGHEIDTTIADMAADMRAPTPSAAAELAVPEISQLLGRIEELKKRVFRDTEKIISERERALLSLEKDVQLHSPRSRISGWEQRLEHIYTLASHSIHKKLDSAESGLQKNAAVISNLNPLGVLSRGYSVTKLGGRVVKSAAELSAGDVIEIRLNKGSVSAAVKDVTDD